MDVFDMDFHDTDFLLTEKLPDFITRAGTEEPPLTEFFQKNHLLTMPLKIVSIQGKH